MPQTVGYIGRFAPSPSGPLHFGSLVAAVGSYLCARSQQGTWLVRMEDLDPPREQPGAADTILRQLEHYGLHWDGTVMYQSQRYDAYEAAISQLSRQGLVYACRCTRKQIMADGGFYAGTCREQSYSFEPGGSALRIHNHTPVYRFTDRLQGDVEAGHHMAAEDFIIKRKDSYYAYQLAVVVDDIAQKVNDIVRGADLLETTVRQLYLYHQLGSTPPSYLHLPLAMRDAEQKLSKQNLAPALPHDDNTQASRVLAAALAFLGHPLPDELQGADCQTQLTWATDAWNLQNIPALQQLPAPVLP